jgi:phosphoglycerate dehydrogenase-like enzyme
MLMLLKPNAALVNTARGEVIVEEELAKLLSSRPDLRVALDVLAGEVRGTQYDSPLLPYYQSGQIIITPHMAGVTRESQTKAARGALDVIRRHLSTRAFPVV